MLVVVAGSRDPRRPLDGSAEAAMATGLILLAFIAALITLLWMRMRRRLGMGATTRAWVVTMTVIILAVLALWVYQTQG
jgi:hypothetical protein